MSAPRTRLSSLGSCVEKGTVPRFPVRYGFKRAIGTDERFSVGQASFSADDLTVLVLRFIRQQTERLLGRPVTQALGSAPANFSTKKRNLLAACFARAGFTLIRLIGEPCAAALNLVTYGNAKVLVVDFGGGTLDVSVLEVGDNVFEVFSVSGDNQLGGLDFDSLVEDFLRKKLIAHFGPIGRFLFERNALLFALEAERAKIQLSSGNRSEIVVSGLDTGDGTFEVFRCEIGREDFEVLADGLVKRAEVCIDNAISFANTRYYSDQISVVMLAGQGCRIGPIAELVRRKSLGTKLVTEFQENAVVRGLTIEAGILQGHLKESLLLDASYRGLAVGCTEVSENDYGNRLHKVKLIRIGEGNIKVEPIIHQNTTIPTQRSILIGDCGELPVHIQLFEFESSPNSSPEPLGVLILEQVGAGNLIELQADIDADALCTLMIRRYPQGRWSQTIALSRPLNRNMSLCLRAYGGSRGHSCSY